MADPEGGVVGVSEAFCSPLGEHPSATPMVANAKSADLNMVLPFKTRFVTRMDQGFQRIGMDLVLGS